MRIFLSLPMRGRENESIYRRLGEMSRMAHEEWPGENVEVVNNFWSGDDSDRFTNMCGKDISELNPTWYLGRAIQRMGICDAVLFDHDWSEARGCRIEHAVAEEYGMKIFYIGKDGEIQ